MKNWITNNFWIKVISLILAVIAWFYVNEDLNKKKRLSSEFHKSSYTRHTQSKQTLPKKPMNRGYIMEKK